MKYGKEIKIGAIVTFGICALIWGINYLKGIDMFTTQKKYFVVYNAVDGLVASNPIQINGLKIGQVRTLEMLQDGTGRIIATLLVEGNIPITKNSMAKIVSIDLLGAKAIQIILGINSPIAQSGDTLLGDIQPSLSDEVNRQVAPLKQKAENLLGSIDSVMVVLQSVFDEQSRRNISQSFESIKNTLHRLEHASVSLDTLVTTEQHRIREIFGNLESITSNLKNNNEHISNIIKNFSSISDTLAKANITTTINNAEKALFETSEILAKINRGEGSMGMLINNDSLYNNLNNAAGSLDKLMIDLRENPKRYVQFSLIGGTKKE